MKFEKMIYDIASHYHLSPEYVGKNFTEYDYWEFLALKLTEQKIERIINGITD